MNETKVFSIADHVTPKFNDKGSAHTLTNYDTDVAIVNNGGGNQMKQKAIVRRLTPMECERLQGFPDGWTDIGEWTDTKGKVHKPSDTPRYKALGNSIALPFGVGLQEELSESYKPRQIIRQWHHFLMASEASLSSFQNMAVSLSGHQR